MDVKVNQENWEVRSEGCKLLHYWNGKTKLCNTIKHNIMQTAPPKGQATTWGIIILPPDFCTACLTLIQDKLK